ncbi:unnamed protein product [Adineta ricciae]|uniref:Uncharacterized protein n=1 Tax=Adineta ricciae TaxID=249248 RepID=A0A814YI39_ADIRI|nr:unnamed protein product [Adineta ricciae]CAF1540994.1 unnamed protein product [Adineta ricciae]
MILRNKIFNIFIKFSLLHFVLAQNKSRDGSRADSNGAECPNPGDFPLFGPSSCISREAYTAIFLTSIILAGVSFLLLIGLSIIFCLRRSKSSRATDSDGGMSSRTSSASHSSISRIGTPPRTRESQHERKHHQQSSSAYYGHTTVPDSSAPYTAAKPVSKQPISTKVTTVVHTAASVHEMTSHRAEKPSRQITSKQIDRERKTRYSNDSSQDGNISSQF